MDIAESEIGDVIRLKGDIPLPESIDLMMI